MCGRFLIQYHWEIFAEHYGLDDRYPDEVVLPFPVVRPGSTVPTVVLDADGRREARPIPAELMCQRVGVRAN